MKVLHVIPSLAKGDGGPAHAVLLMKQALSGAGIAIHIATTDDDGPGRRLAVLPADSHSHYFAKRIEFYKVAPGFLWWMLRHVRNYDVVHIHALFSFISVAAAWISAVAGVPYILRPLGTLNHYGMKQQHPVMKRLSFRWIEGPLLHRAGAVHFTALAEKAEAESLGVAMRGVVVPLGIDSFVAPDPALLARFFPQLTASRYVLFLSRLDPKKNIENLLRAFATLETAPDVRLVVAGDGDPAYVMTLTALAAQLGLKERVVWTGFVAGERKAALLGAAHSFVLPSFSENFGIAAAEALMAGLPCILSTGVAIAREVSAAGAGLAVAPAEADIANALRSLLTNETLCSSMRINAAVLAQTRYSLSTMGMELIQLYDKLARKHD